MDFIKNLFNRFRKRPSRYPSTVLNSGKYGNWYVEVNPGYGIVLRNLITPDEFHFCEKSNGWVTTLRKQNPENHYYYVLNPSNVPIPNGKPFFADKQTIKNHKRQKIEETKKSLQELEKIKG